jgi:hypothetical protein
MTWIELIPIRWPFYKVNELNRIETGGSAAGGESGGIDVKQ